MDWLWRILASRLESYWASTNAGAVVESSGPPKSTDAEPSAEDVFHNAALKFLEQQLASNRDLDNRSTQSFQVGSAVVTIAFGLLTLSRTQVRVPEHARQSLYVALGAYALVLVFSFIASLYRRIEFRPDIATVGGYVGAWSGTDLKHWVALEYQASTEANRGMLQTKSRLVGAAIACLYVEGACLALAALFTLV